MIRFSIRTKLAALLSALSLLLVVAILWVVKASFDKGFQEYLNEAMKRNLVALATNIARHAENPGAWQRFIAEPQQWDRYLREFQINLDGADALRPLQHRPELDDERGPPRPRNRRLEPGPWGPGPGRLPPRGGGRPLWLLDSQQQVIYGPQVSENDRRLLMLTEIKTATGSAGYVASRAVRARDNAADAVFAEQQHRLFLWIAVVAVLSSIVLSWPISRYLVNPVQTLSKAMRVVMQRQYKLRVPVGTNDELGDLANDFNLMAQTLEEHDSKQRQWLADISHELRTPLSVLKGELEAVQDGVMPMDQATVGSLVEEVAQLSRLVDDLHQLTVTQVSHLRYRLEPLNLVDLLTRLASRLENLMHSAKLRYGDQLPSQGAWIDGDAQRLEQLIMNLAQNSVRYTDAGGCVRLTIDVTECVVLSWEDSAPGVEADEIPHLFDRFYRVEKSRQRALGGSGLGLSIVANIAEAHHADICAQPSELGGLLIKIAFPRCVRRV